MVVRFDHNHPLLLGVSDTPGVVQVGIELTGMENYTLWSRAMKLTLLTKNKIGFIDGSITCEKFGVDLVNQWDRSNAMVISWIMSNVSKGLLFGILFRSIASSVWEDLRERFNKINLSQVYHLHKEIATLVQGTLHVSVYYSRLKDL
ncbi:hypothetical protein KY285_036889 [Solanum tuberosum]|nr:hypothetical protein KY285_036889 [Solanum tuberosum]